MGLRSWLSIGFKEKEKEAAFKTFYQSSMPTICLTAGCIEILAILVVTLPRLNAERTENQFSWGGSDPRTVFFAIWFGILVCNGIPLSVIAVLKRRGFLVRVDMELVIGAMSMFFWPIFAFLTPWRIAILCGQEPEIVWYSTSKYAIQTFVEQELIMVMAIVALVGAVSLFVPLRMHLLFTLDVIVILSYLVAGYAVGTPLTPTTQRPVVVLLLAMLLCVVAGARRNEQGSRNLWTALGQSEYTLQNTKDTVHEQESQLSELRVSMQAGMRLMQTMCDVVFQAGTNLCVIQSNFRLDVLLGPMQGRYLEEALENEEQRDRLRLILNPMLSDLEGETHMNTVLVPPVRFAPSVSSQSYVRAAFEAEVVVADTHQWQNHEQGRWRYLVGLKVVRQAENGYEGSSPAERSEASSNNPDESEASPSTDELGTFDAEVRTSDELLMSCSPGWNLLFGKQMEGSYLYHLFSNVQQVVSFQKAAQSVQQFSRPEMLRNVTLISQGGGNLRASMRICKQLDTSSPSTSTTEADARIVIQLHDVVRTKGLKNVKNGMSPAVALSAIQESQDAKSEIAVASAPDGFMRAKSDAEDTYSSSPSWGTVPAKTRQAKAKRWRNNLVSEEAEPVLESPPIVGLKSSPPAFWKQTPERTIEFALCDLLHQFLIRPGDATRTCCWFHTAADMVKGVMTTVVDRPCDPHFTPFSSWQCSQCHSCNQETWICATCGADVDASMSRLTPNDSTTDEEHGDQKHYSL